MSFKVYNSLNKKTEIFKPINDGKVLLYTCGPTVYDYAHIGNFRTFIFEDLLKRWLMHLGYEVKHIMNITDVDDKTIEKARRKKESLSSITEKYTEEFLKDIKWLKLIPANFYPKATNYIKEMIELIKILLDKNLAYIDDNGSVYYNVTGYSDYGKLGNVKPDNLQKRKRISDDEYGKNSIQDFALWKSYKKIDGAVYWDSPWGKGRPGWHIECSAMSMTELGEHFDIHCGGVDNMFPHHDNEIAQSEGVTGRPFVNYWMHSEFLLIDGGKMSKSLGNVFKIEDLKKMGFSPESIRFQLLSAHYRTKVIFSESKKKESDKVIKKFLNFHNLLKELSADTVNNWVLPKEYNNFKEKMDNDLDTPGAISVFFSWMKDISKEIKNGKITKVKLGSAWAFLSIFNLIFDFINEEKLSVPKEIKIIFDERRVAREEKNWTLSDDLREKLFNLGWNVEDTEKGQKLLKNN